MAYEDIKQVIVDAGCAADGQPVPKFGRWQAAFPADSRVKRVVIEGPSGERRERPVFTHQPAVLRYDVHGYEWVEPQGDPVLAVRFTPAEAGTYFYQAWSGETLYSSGSFVCVEDLHPGYVEISKKDPRYFAYSNGTACVPIGLNLTSPEKYQQSAGSEFALADQTGTTGCICYRRWFERLAQNGGNYARLWLSDTYFDPESETAGETDALRYARLDQVFALARKYRIRLKLTLEHFRYMYEEKGAAKGQNYYHLFAKKLRDGKTGEACTSMDDWFLKENWQTAWLKKLDGYLARYGDDPVVMAWELWNECNCCTVSDPQIVADWTRNTILRIKEKSPANLAVNSIGSYDADDPQNWWYDVFKNMKERDYQQVHRYLDQGAPYEICHRDPCEFVPDAIRRIRRDDKPAILAETGGVNDCHSGPFRFYSMDDRGIIFSDCTFAAFFAGAAGTGQMWHWGEAYVDAKGLMSLYGPFARMLEGICVDEERFVPRDRSDSAVWCLILAGKKHILGYLRNKEDSWYNVLRDGNRPRRLENRRIELDCSRIEDSSMEIYQLWPEDPVLMGLEGTELCIRRMDYGCLFKIDRS